MNLKIILTPIRTTRILHVAVRACMCLCNYVPVCFHEEGLEEHYVRGDSQREKVSTFR